jgi:hypothetical protein
LSPGELRALAADVAAGARLFQPSLAQTADLFGITAAELREELKARALTLESEHESEAVGAIVTAWSGASELEREQALSAIGVADVWDVLARVIT